jgi:hypothetical protein
LISIKRNAPFYEVQNRLLADSQRDPTLLPALARMVLLIFRCHFDYQTESEDSLSSFPLSVLTLGLEVVERSLSNSTRKPLVAFGELFAVAGPVLSAARRRKQFVDVYMKSMLKAQGMGNADKKLVRWAQEKLERPPGWAGCDRKIL